MSTTDMVIQHQINNAAKVIRDLLHAAQNRGANKPMYCTRDYTYSLAPMTGNNPGAIYIKETDSKDYMGKITADSKLLLASNCASHERINIKDNLVLVAKDPYQMAIAYGKDTGICCCCGRLLTNPISIELGIGPICRGYFGWGEDTVPVTLDMLEDTLTSPEPTAPAPGLVLGKIIDKETGKPFTTKDELLWRLEVITNAVKELREIVINEL